jgi:phage gpG-like protein
MAVSAEIVWDPKPWEELIKTLSDRWQQVETRNEFGAIIASTVYADIIDHFRQEQGSNGKWKSWSDAYAQHMASIGKGGNQILQDSGRLRMSFTPSDYYGTDAGIVFYNRAQTKGGFPYAKAHNEGGPVLPKRDFMWLSNQAMDKIVDIATRWLLGEDN